MSFNLDAHAHTTLAAWLEEHDKTCPLVKYSGACGGRLTYSFTPTSLGTFIEASCSCSVDAKVNLTDLDAI